MRRATARPVRRLRRLVLNMTAAAVALSATTLVAATPTTAHPGQASAVFDPASVGWYSYHALDIAESDDRLKSWGDSGFMPVDIEVDTFEGDLRFGAAAQRNIDGRGWFADTVMTFAEYDAMSATVGGYMRLADREFYPYKGTWYVGALWVANSENLGWYASKFGMTLAELTTFAAQQEHAGRMPVDFDMFTTGSGVRYSAVFQDNPEGLDWRLEADLSYAQFLATDDAYAAAGFRTISMDSATGKTQRYGGIWWENANGRSWASRVHNDDNNYNNWWSQLADMGFRQIFNGRYLDHDGKVRLMSTWRQNDRRYDWKWRKRVDTLIANEMAVEGMPGVSVAVMIGGQFQYTRGFGHADIDDDVWMNSSHVMRTASVSKAIGGTLLLDVAEENATYGLEVTDSASSWVGSLPAAYDPVTLEMLASNRGCVRWYASQETYTDPDVEAAQTAADNEMATTTYADSTEALSLYENDPLVCVPGAYRYSTQAYGPLGAGLEAATGMTTAELIEQRISGPLGLKTLRTEDLDDAGVYRATAYTGAANTEADLYTSQKTFAPLGGGIWSSSTDLCRFGHALATGKILAAPDTIWTASPWSNYAYGWYLDTQNGHVRIAKDGASTGADAYLLIFPDDDIVISVLINRRDEVGDSSAIIIAEAIGALLV